MSDNDDKDLVARCREGNDDAWMEKALAKLTDEVYVTFDVDFFDGSLVPGTGTPEPGGLDWYEVSDLIAAVAATRRIVGCDVVELAPLPGNVASDFLAARMTYRMIGHMLKSQSNLHGPRR